MTNTGMPVSGDSAAKAKRFPLASILRHLSSLASDEEFFGSVTLRFQGPQGVVYIITERGQRPQELEVVNGRS